MFDLFNVEMSAVLINVTLKRQDHREATEAPYLGIIPSSRWLGRIIIVECPLGQTNDASTKLTVS